MPEVLTPQFESAEEEEKEIAGESAEAPLTQQERALFQRGLILESGEPTGEWIDKHAVDFAYLVDDSSDAAELRRLFREDPEAAKEEISRRLEEMKEKKKKAA